MNKVLIVVDVQEDFTRGALRNEEAIKALPKIRELLEFARDNDVKIIYTADTHGEDYLETLEGKNLPVPHCIYRTPGWNLCKEVVLDDYPVMPNLIMKETFGAIVLTKYYNGSTQAISAADEVWMCGFCTDICVSANFQLIKAFYPNLNIIVIGDCCAGVTPELHESALKVMGSCQALIMDLEQLKTHVQNEKENHLLCQDHRLCQE